MADSQIHRRVLNVALQRLLDEPVLLLQGPRTAGKTHLLNELAKHCGTQVIDLDDPATRDAVRADAATFLRGPEPILIDEYQHERSVLAAIKAELNTDLHAGRFILAGSTRSTAIPEVAEFLAGRVSRLPVLPFSQGEIDGTLENLVQTLLFGDAATVVNFATSMTTRDEYVRRIVRGGMPLAVARSSTSARNRWFDDYVPLVLARTANDIKSIRQPDRIAALLARLAAQTSQLLNITSASQVVGIARQTGTEYLAILEDLFLVRQVPAWGRALSARSNGKPKVHLLDAGLAARLLRITPEHMLRRDASALTEFGHLLETFVVEELIKQATWIDEVTTWHHWRTRDGDEVDLVLERDDGRIVGVEVKAGTRVLEDDLRGLKKLQTLVGDSFSAGVVFYTGERSYSPVERLFVLPADRIWTAV